MISNVFISDYHIYSPLGNGVEKNMQSLIKGQTAVNPLDGFIPDHAIAAARISDDMINEDCKSLGFDIGQLTRIERLIVTATQPLIQKLNRYDRLQVILSTTKGNVSALNSSNNQNGILAELASNVQHLFQLPLKPIIVCNACVSGSLSIALGKRLIQMGQCDDVIVIAVDELTPFVVSGFYSFQALSDQPCRPYDRDRNGINLGEAGAAIHLTSSPTDICIIGEASINDANHISGPSRTGTGLRKSIENALAEAQLDPTDIDFISAHGTATIYNDDMEAIVFHSLGMKDIPVHSLKGYYGHTLGAAGVLESIIAIESMRNHVLIPTLGYRNLGVSQSINIIDTFQESSLDFVLKTASGFGGCNTALIFSKNKNDD